MKKILNDVNMMQYLEENKKIEHVEVEKIKNLGYCNVISVYKHKFHIGKDENNKHIYPRIVNFEEYLKCYTQEREDYEKLLYNAVKFESIFKNLVIHYFFSEFEVKAKSGHSEEELINFWEQKNKNFKSKNNNFKNKIIADNKIFFDNLRTKKGNIYVLLNISKYSSIRSIYYLLDSKNKKKIADIIYNEYGYNALFNSRTTWHKFLEYNLQYFIGIRNVLAHNTSIYYYKRLEEEKYTKDKWKTRNYNINKVLGCYEKI